VVRKSGILSIMGLLQIELALRPGESSRWKKPANQVRKGIAVGGTLAVTDQRVLFQPNRIERATGRKVWECSPPEVTAIESIERQPGAVLGGGIRRRLAMETTSGPEVFVIDDVDRTAEELRDLLGVGGTGLEPVTPSL
jgi:hypothetical protein